ALYQFGMYYEKVMVPVVAALPFASVAVTVAVPAAARLTVVVAVPVAPVVALLGVTVAPETVVNVTASP
ncbi:hypothetical protein SP019_00320, partial [Salmonella phage FSL SP-019]